MSDPIRDALREAGEAARRSLYPGMCRDGACMLAPCACADEAAAAAVVAFHYKRADDLNAMGREYWPQAAVHVDIAAAVEAAAREGE